MMAPGREAEFYIVAFGRKGGGGKCSTYRLLYSLSPLA